MTSPPDMARLADELEAAKPGWLPISGHVVNFTFTLTDRDRVVAALRTPIPDTPLDARTVEAKIDVFGIAVHALTAGAPGISPTIRDGIARSISMRVKTDMRALLREDREG